MATRTPVSLENSKTDMGDGGVSTYLSRSSALFLQTPVFLSDVAGFLKQVPGDWTKSII